MHGNWLHKKLGRWQIGKTAQPGTTLFLLKGSQLSHYVPCDPGVGSCGGKTLSGLFSIKGLLRHFGVFQALLRLRSV